MALESAAVGLVDLIDLWDARFFKTVFDKEKRGVIVPQYAAGRGVFVVE